jgi:hypothetical protein
MDAKAAAQYLAQACERHGGRSAFEAMDQLGVRLASLKGAVPWLKGLGHTFPSPAAVELWPHERRARFLDYPRAGTVGIYEAGRVAIGDVSVSISGPRHRETFHGLSKWRRWTPLDALYFFGYALLDYVSLPFALRERELIEARRRGSSVELWYRCPSAIDTHSAVQGFYFDETGLLLRHDYRAEIIGNIFNGAHVHRDHRSFRGVLVATRRTVYFKPWHYPVRARLPLPVLEARLLPR